MRRTFKVIPCTRPKQAEDLTGKKFNKLTVIKFAGKSDTYNKPLWECLCDCGKITHVEPYGLKNGSVQSCGCLNREFRSLEHKDVSGRKFGRLTIIRYTRHINKKPFVLVKCECGMIKELSWPMVQTGGSRSCGCLKSDRVSEHLYKEDGLSRSKWCSYKNSKNAKKKGFDLSFEEFVSIASKDCHYCGAPPEIKTRVAGVKNRERSSRLNGIDRVDNEKGYVKGNVVPCCRLCNNSKKDFLLEEFFNWADRLVAHQKNLKEQNED